MRKLKNEELGRLSVNEFKETTKNPIVVILDNIRSFNNIGSVFRSSDAFLIQKVYLCGITGIPPHRDIQKTALGATESVEWEYLKTTEEAVVNCKDNGFEIIAIEQTENSIPLNEFQLEAEKKYAIILGNEVKGVQQSVVDLCDKTIEIPQEGTKHSLNISVCNGIVFWDFYQKLKQIQAQ